MVTVNIAELRPKFMYVLFFKVIYQRICMTGRGITHNDNVFSDHLEYLLSTGVYPSCAFPLDSPVASHKQH